VHRTIEVLKRVNADLRGMALQNGDDRMIATTVACLLGFDDGRCVCVWAGDSRIYRWRRGELTRLTRDHSQVQEMIEQRALDPAQAAGHRLRNVITRAVGAQDDLDLDQRLEGVESGDVFLLCSDGLHTLVSDPELAALLGRGSPAELARVLVHLAVARGAPDNVTVGVVQP
jgi:serine/threonine protein phosphatase PrpC